MIIDTNTQAYKDYWFKKAPKGSGRFNGAFFYSQEIVKNMLPYIETNRNIDTLGMRAVGSLEHSIVFIHHCINWDTVYGWLDEYADHIYVVSTRPTFDWFRAHNKKTILLPLSIDVEFVSRFKADKTKGACYAGNRWAFKREDEDRNIPSDCDFPPKNLPREELLKFIAPYRELYAIGRCALEGLVLGCKIQPFYRAYPDPSYWRVLDNKDAAKLLQRAINEIEAGVWAVDCFEWLS